MIVSKNITKVVGIAGAVILCCCFIVTPTLEAGEKKPERGIEIIFSIYSGRPNPQLWLTEGPEFEKLVSLLKDLKPQVQEEKLFNYSKWNTLGYTSIWIFPKNIEDLPYAMHIWLDEASVTMRKGENIMQAVGVMPIYEMLANHVLKTNQIPEKFFRRYIKFRAAKEKKDKEEKENPKK